MSNNGTFMSVYKDVVNKSDCPAEFDKVLALAFT